MNSNVTGRVIFEAVHEKLLDTKDSSARCGRYDGHIDQLYKHGFHFESFH